jgi:hypothetical protein
MRARTAWLVFAAVAVIASPALAGTNPTTTARRLASQIRGTAPAPPRVVFQDPPRMVQVPGTRVFEVDRYERPAYDMFRYDDRYYIFNDGYWYEAPRYNGPFSWMDERDVPGSIHQVPSSHWRRHPGLRGGRAWNDDRSYADRSRQDRSRSGRAYRSPDRSGSRGSWSQRMRDRAEQERRYQEGVRDRRDRAYQDRRGESRRYEERRGTGRRNDDRYAPGRGNDGNRDKERRDDSKKDRKSGRDDGRGHEEDGGKRGRGSD